MPLRLGVYLAATVTTYQLFGTDNGVFPLSLATCMLILAYGLDLNGKSACSDIRRKGHVDEKETLKEEKSPKEQKFTRS